MFLLKKRIIAGVWFISVFTLILVPLNTNAAGVDDAANSVLLPIRIAVMGIVFVLGKVLTLVAQFVDFILRLPVAYSPVVESSWIIVRDFSNMFFIVFLIIMAFATIFDVGSFGYGGYDIGSLMGRFLIAALLINFSLVIGQEIIGWTQVLNTTFLTSMGPIGDRVLESLQPYQLLNQNDLLARCALKDPQALTTAECGGGKYLDRLNNIPIIGAVKQAIQADIAAFRLFLSITGETPEQNMLGIFSGLFSSFFLAMLIFSLAVPAVFGLIRIPYLWFLLIMSPLAWLTMVLPSTRSVNQSWWKQFWGWNLFLPIYLFFLTIGISFLAKQQEVMSAILNAWAGNAGLGAAAVATKILTPVEIIFFYVLAGIIFIGGAGMAFKSSFVAGTAAAGAASWARGAVGRVTGVTATGRALKARGEQMQKEGVRAFGMQVYGGQAGLETQTGKAGALFGVRGADVAAQKPFVEALGKEYSSLQDGYKTGKISNEQIRKAAESGSATDPKTLAYRKMAAEMGMLTPEMLTSTTKELARSPLALNNFMESAKKGKFQELTPEMQLAAASASTYTDKKTGKTYDFSSLGETPSALEGRREIFSAVADNKKAIKNLTLEQYKSAVSLYGGPGTVGAREFMKKVDVQRPDLATNPEIQKMLPDAMRKTVRSIVADAKPETIAEMDISIWYDKQTNTPNKEFVDILTKRLRDRDSDGRKRLYSQINEEISGSGIDDASIAIKLGILNDALKAAGSSTGGAGDFKNVDWTQYQQKP